MLAHASLYRQIEMVRMCEMDLRLETWLLPWMRFRIARSTSMYLLCFSATCSFLLTRAFLISAAKNSGRKVLMIYMVRLTTTHVVRSSRGARCATYIEEVCPSNRSTLNLALGVRKVNSGELVCDGPFVEVVTVELPELGNLHPTNLCHGQESLLPP